MKKISVLLLALLVLSSCEDDLFERDISGEDVNVIIPQPNHQSTIQQVQFKWDPVEGASGYRIQLVSPNFDTIQSFLLDSVVSTETFNYTLVPGTYQWKIRAENNSSYSNYSSVFNIKIDSTQDVTGQTVNLLLPLNGSYTNDGFPSFSWITLSSANGYDIEIKQGNDFLTGTTVESGSSTAGNYTPSSALPEGDYVWGVRGTNSTTSTTTDFFHRTFTLDQTTPNSPTLVSPDGTTFAVNQAITFSWNRMPENGAYPSPLSDSVFIYSNAALTTLYKRFSSSTTSVVDSIPNTGTYYWRVKTFDEAGNVSGFSTDNSFIIQ